MNILMLCTRFPLEPGNEYLTNELADALVADGHHVQVVVIDWDALPGKSGREVTTAAGVSVLSLSPTMLKGCGQTVERVTKWLFSPIMATREMKRRLAGKSFDAVIGFTPATVLAAQFLWARRRFKPRSYLVLWDFFPFHQRSIGLIPDGLVFSITRTIEQAVIRRFDVIGCMSPMNIAYLRRNYSLNPEQKVECLSIWGQTGAPMPEPVADVRIRHKLPTDKHIVVFGGQITEGRGIEEILATADIARESRPDIAFLLIGQGRLADEVQNRISQGAVNVIYRERIPRVDYLSLVAACDVGLVVTVRNVDVPTFPSKIIDYLRSGVPVVASVETSTDFGNVIERHGIGKSIEAGSPVQLLATIESLLDQPGLRQEMAQAGRNCLEEVFDVKQAARTISASLRSS